MRGFHNLSALACLTTKVSNTSSNGSCKASAASTLSGRIWFRCKRIEEMFQSNRCKEPCNGKIFFFYCVAERAVKPCRSSRSNTRGGMIKSHDTCKTGSILAMARSKNLPDYGSTSQKCPPSPLHGQSR